MRKKPTAEQIAQQQELTQLMEEYLDRFDEGFPMCVIGIGSYTVEEALPVIRESLRTGIPAKPKYTDFEYKEDCYY